MTMGSAAEDPLTVHCLSAILTQNETAPRFGHQFRLRYRSGEGAPGKRF